MSAQATWRVAFALALAGVTVLLLMPSPPAPPGPPGYNDLLAHLFLFAVLAFLAAHAFARAPRWRVVLALVLFGAAMEALQATVGRSPSLADVAADAAGASLAWLVRRKGASS